MLSGARGRPGEEGDLTDEALLQATASGDPAALGELHRRHADLVYAVARRDLDPAAAEDIVQEVFLAVWNRATTFDPGLGPVRPWLARIARTRTLNELRRRGRHPAEPSDVEPADPALPPDVSVQRALRGRALREALALLPAKERRAIGLAFFDELTHRELAAAMEVPLGTAKDQVRTGLRRLAGILGPALVVILAVRLVLVARESEREERALRMVTTSDSETVRIPAAPGREPAIHGTWRDRAGTPIAVLTVSAFPPGRSFDVRVRHGDAWTGLGVVESGVDGHGLLIVEGEAVELPDEIVVVNEGGEVLIRWRRS